jgi:hypothetical protein
MKKCVEYNLCILPDNANLYLKYVSMNELVFHKIVNVIMCNYVELKDLTPVVTIIIPVLAVIQTEQASSLGLEVVTISVTCEMCHFDIYLTSNINVQFTPQL